MFITIPQIILSAAISFAFLLILAVILVSFAMFRKAIYRNRTSARNTNKSGEIIHKTESHSAEIFREASERLMAEPSETYLLTSRDGLNLRAHYIPHAASLRSNEPEFILLGMHGYRSDAYKEFGIYSDFYRYKLRADMMLPDQRAHGESKGKYICYGVKERFDLLDWIDLTNRVSERKYGHRLPIYVHGISMGCATVLMSCELGWPSNVKGIIADCGYTSPGDIFRHILKNRYHLPGFPFLSITEIMTKKTAGFSFDESSTVKSLENVRENIPILFIHGGDDNFVPAYMSRENYSAYKGSKKLLIIEGAGHAKSYYENTDAYEAAVTDLVSGN